MPYPALLRRENNQSLDVFPHLAIENIQCLLRCWISFENEYR